MKLAAALLVAVAAYLYLNLFLLPGTPILLNGDQVFFWMDGQRMLGGELPYRDFFQFTPPGTDLFYWAVFRIFGTRIWVLNATVLLLGIALSWVCYDIAARIMNRRLAVVGTLLFVTLIYSEVLTGSHHWFSMLAIMCAVTSLLPEVSSRRLVVAGALLGIASFCTHTHGVVALIAISLFLKIRTDSSQTWQGLWKAERSLLVGFTVFLLSLNLYFIASVGWRQLLYLQGFYILRAKVSRPETALLGMPEYLSFRALPLLSVIYQYGQYVAVYTLLPVTYFLVWRRAWRKGDGLASHQFGIALLGTVGASLLVEQLFSLNWLRLYTVSMPGIVLFTWFISKIRRMRRYAVAVMSIAIITLAVQHVWATQHHNHVVADLPAGRCVMDNLQYEELTWVMQHTKPGDFLFDANWPGLYVPLHLRNPVFLDTASTTLDPVWAGRAVQELEAKRVRYVIWAARLDYPVDPHHPSTSHIVPLRNYLRACYQPTKIFSNGEQVWERK